MPRQTRPCCASFFYVIFHNVPVLGGLDFRAAALVYALAALSFSLGDLLTGDIDRIPVYVRSGNLDTLLVRPLPLLAQLVTGDVQLRRLGRVLVALGILAVQMRREMPEGFAPAPAWDGLSAPDFQALDALLRGLEGA